MSDEWFGFDNFALELRYNPITEYMGCFMENSGEHYRQEEPQFLTSFQGCPEEYAYVGFTNPVEDTVEWSCFYELPPTTADGCESYGDWNVGGHGWKSSVYRNPNYEETFGWVVNEFTEDCPTECG
eukprot:UN24679